MAYLNEMQMTGAFALHKGKCERNLHGKNVEIVTQSIERFFFVLQMECCASSFSNRLDYGLCVHIVLSLVLDIFTFYD